MGVERLVEVCDICGDVGTQELILTCPVCKISREHAYCRKVITVNHLDHWSCDDCKGKRNILSEVVNQDLRSTIISKPSGYARGKGTCSALKARNQIKEKIVTKGKVKYITSEEAIMLSSGSKRGNAVKNFNSSLFRTERPMCSKTQVHQKGLPLKSAMKSASSANNKQTKSMIQRQGNEKHILKEMEASQSIRKEHIQMAEPAAKTKDTGLVKETSMRREALSLRAPERPSALAIRSVKFAADTKFASSGKKISVPSSARSLPRQLPQPISSAIRAGETKVANMRKETSVPKEASCAPFLKKQLMQPSTSGHQISGDLDPKFSVVENCELKNIEPKAKEFSRGPARDPSWKGQFKILDSIVQNINSEFEARPCCRGYRKVLDCSKRMPQLLQFKLIPRKDVWRNFFKGRCPDEDDIGLYFYPGENKRSSVFDLVLMLIETQDLAMRCDISGAELYLFTSKTLSADHQKLDGEYFFWGVLRKIKKHKDVLARCKELPPAVHQPSDSLQNNDNGDGTVVDMEIDMIGGKDVGRIDIPVPKDVSRGANSMGQLSSGF